MKFKRPLGGDVRSDQDHSLKESELGEMLFHVYTMVYKKMYWELNSGGINNGGELGDVMRDIWKSPLFPQDLKEHLSNWRP